MLLKAFIAALLLVTTTLIHLITSILIVRILEKRQTTDNGRINSYHFCWISVIILLLFFISLLEIICWAGAYWWLGAIATPEPALYFSMVTYTTLGYGDIVLSPHWRLLSGFEAINGIIMFGWTTALVVYSIQNIRKKNNL
jgi:hypothetical protein